MFVDNKVDKPPQHGRCSACYLGGGVSLIVEDSTVWQGNDNMFP